jgi:hypothetical protein
LPQVAICLKTTGGYYAAGGDICYGNPQGGYYRRWRSANPQVAVPPGGDLLATEWLYAEVAAAS